MTILVSGKAGGIFNGGGGNLPTPGPSKMQPWSVKNSNTDKKAIGYSSSFIGKHGCIWCDCSYIHRTRNRKLSCKQPPTGLQCQFTFQLDGVFDGERAINGIEREAVGSLCWFSLPLLSLSLSLPPSLLLSLPPLSPSFHLLIGSLGWKWTSFTLPKCPGSLYCSRWLTASHTYTNLHTKKLKKNKQANIAILLTTIYTT